MIRGRFAWQEGYGAFSVSTSQIENTIQYIRNQREHHQKQTFEEEYILFLKKNGMEYDERFVFGYRERRPYGTLQKNAKSNIFNNSSHLENL